MSSPATTERFQDVAFTTPVPFSDDTTTVLYDEMGDHLSALYETGARLFIPNGNTGEYYSLTDEERINIVETHVEATGDDATVAAGAAGSVQEVSYLSSVYEEVGADAVMVMHPIHTYIHQKGLVEYYHQICDETDLDVVIYKRGPAINRELLVELSEREEVVAVKFAVNDIQELTSTMAAAEGDVTWMNGIAEGYALSFTIEGAAGFTTGVGNFVPEASLELFDAIQNKEWERARSLEQLLLPLEDLRDEPGEHNALAGANNIPVVKYGMELAGFTGGPVRPPLVGLNETDERRVEEYYERIQAGL